MNNLLLVSLAVLVVFCQGRPIEPTSSPTHLQITTFGDDTTAWFTLKWNEVFSDKSDPVTGYKVGGFVSFVP